MLYILNKIGKHIFTIIISIHNLTKGHNKSESQSQEICQNPKSIFKTTFYSATQVNRELGTENQEKWSRTLNMIISFRKKKKIIIIISFRKSCSKRIYGIAKIGSVNSDFEYFRHSHLNCVTGLLWNY